MSLIVVTLLIPLMVSMATRSPGVWCSVFGVSVFRNGSRFSVGSISLNFMFGNFCFSLGSSFIGRESCLSRGLPNIRIFIFFG